MEIQEMKEVVNVAAELQDCTLLLVFLSLEHPDMVTLHDADGENNGWCCHLGEDGERCFKAETAFQALAQAATFIIRMQEQAQHQASTS